MRFSKNNANCLLLNKEDVLRFQKYQKLSDFQWIDIIIQLSFHM